MKSTISYFKILAGASCVLALAACDAIKDVPQEPTGALPAPAVVLSGEIRNLSSLRSITLMNNGDTINTRSFINAAPTTPNEGVRPVPFSFGGIAAGTPYNVTVKTQPDLKNCVVVNGTGVLTEGVRPDIVINCTNIGTRYKLSVNIPSDPTLFKGLQGAKVRVTTEEEIREVAVTATTVSPVVFDGVLINATGTLNGAPWSVTASTFEGDTLNKCVVGATPSNIAVVAGVTVVTNAIGDIATPVVGAVPTTTPATINSILPACKFTVSGRIGYSLPAGATTIPTISGLKLQLRDLQANTLGEVAIPDCTPTSATVTTSTASTTLGATVPVPAAGPTCVDYSFTTGIRSSTTSGLYEVAVSQHPTGQFCIVVNGGSISVFTQGTVAPISPTNVNVFCRATPATAGKAELQGVYRLQSTTFVTNAPLNSPAPVTSTWLPFDLTAWNTASSNMIAFFKNGTFLYGTHANGAQVEHGFYDYDAPAQKLRFTSIVDTNTSTVFPANFSPVPIVPAGSTFTQITNLFTATPGLSALPNPIRQNGTTFATAHAAMTGVTLGTANSGLGTVKTISGTFGADPAGQASFVPVTTGTCTTATSCVSSTTGAALPIGTACTTGSPCYAPPYAYRVSWTLQEPPQVAHEMTGTWLSQDSRRFFVWDYRTYYGTAVGVLGGSPSMNDACFSMDDLHSSSGIYTRRGSATGCFPYARPASDVTTGASGVFGFGRNGTLPGYFALGTESVDLTLAGTAVIAIIPTLPGYTGRIPGGEPAPGASSPSPIYFQVAPAATFFSVASQTYFPTASTSWCTTEILGLRATANGFPINTPVYFCRSPAP